MLEIRPISLADVVAYREAVAAVMSERRFLAYTEVFSLEESAAFVAKNIRLNNPHWVAIDNTKVIGWCDIRREEIPSALRNFRNGGDPNPPVSQGGFCRRRSQNTWS